MARVYTASSLIEGIKRRASIPQNQATFGPEDFLAFADEELKLGILPEIMSLHQDYFLFESDTTIEADVTEYEIPARALGNKLRDLQYKPDPKTYIEMTRVGIGDRFTSSGIIGDIRRFYVKNNKVVISPTLDSTGAGSLNFVFYIKPSQLVLEDRIGIIQSITNLGATTALVLSQIPEDFSTSITYDFYKFESPNTISKIDLVPVSLTTATKTIVFNTSDIPATLKVGDHVSQAGETNIPQIPEEFNAMLEQMVACRILEAQGDSQGLQNALIKLKQMTDAGGDLIDNRIEDAPRKIVNRSSLLRVGVSRRYRRR